MSKRYGGRSAPCSPGHGEGPPLREGAGLRTSSLRKRAARARRAPERTARGRPPVPRAPAP
jgi:hypothetical protein